jgi:hypothetical protein
MHKKILRNIPQPTMYPSACHPNLSSQKMLDRLKNIKTYILRTYNMPDNIVKAIQKM